jgi:hypothetical protein
MNKLILISSALLFLASCVKENTPTLPVNDQVDTTLAAVQYRGTFGNGPFGSVSGTAKIYLQNNQQTLALENFSSSNGPDLHVYLSKEMQPVNYIDLGKLQSVSGNQLYSINSTVNIQVYKYALIHCQRYNHLFGSAVLQ